MLFRSAFDDRETVAGGEVVAPPCLVVVDDEHVVAARHQALRDMGADEAGAPGNQYLHNMEARLPARSWNCCCQSSRLRNAQRLRLKSPSEAISRSMSKPGVR